MQPEAQVETTRTEGVRARRVACDILEAVLQKSQPLDQVIENHKDFTLLPVRDRAFVRMVTATTLRRLGQVDNFINRAMNQTDPPRPSSLHSLLRLAAAQIAFMDVPDYAVVDTAVHLADQMDLKKQKGLVNAVLRRVAFEHKEWLGKQDAVTMNIPAWLMQSWIGDYGLRTAAEIGQASLSEAPLDITVKEPDMLKYWEGTLHAPLLPTGSLRRAEGGAIYDLPGYSDGGWWIQDAAASIPAYLFGDVTGCSIVDMCAAPGGKTAQLAAMGAHVTAIDRSVNRMKRLNENIERLQLSASVTGEIADAAAWKPRYPVTHILLDAPCSATGTMRRHPDLMHLKKPQDIDRLIVIQQQLLNHALDILQTGGILIYCTCSLQKAEGERQIAEILAGRPDVQRVPILADEFGGQPEMITPDGDVRLLPFHMAAYGGLDGFFISRIVKPG